MAPGEVGRPGSSDSTPVPRTCGGACRGNETATCQGRLMDRECLGDGDPDVRVAV